MWLPSGLNPILGETFPPVNYRTGILGAAAKLCDEIITAISTAALRDYLHSPLHIPADVPRRRAEQGLENLTKIRLRLLLL
ncbi:hypothetical protein VTN96DRAFT_5037 [Rasamsonia emersonii]